MNIISLIIPSHNSESTIYGTLKSLSTQSKQIHEIIIVNDGSTDNSLKIIKKYFKNHFLKIEKKIINHPHSLGLSASYNDGIIKSKGDLIITLHSDIILKKNAVSLLIAPFDQNDIVASFHQSIHPLSTWKKYNFWQQAYFDRQLRQKQSGLDGKFDCFRKKELFQVGLFDNKNFFRAGEDGDIFLKLSKIGRVISTNATIIHLHDSEPKFNYKNIIYKQAQYSEAQGAFLKRYKFISLKHFLHTFFRELLIIGLFLPYIKYFSLFFILIYSLLYTKNTILNNLHDIRILILPLLNIYLLLVSFYFSIKGYISGKQTI